MKGAAINHSCIEVVTRSSIQYYRSFRFSISLPALALLVPVFTYDLSFAHAKHREDSPTYVNINSNNVEKRHWFSAPAYSIVGVAVVVVVVVMAAVEGG